MSLAAVLSTMRSLILDGITLPRSEEERVTFLRANFQGLNQIEIEDLAKINPEKLAYYTQTIFAGERSVLKNHFPITFALIKERFDPNIDFFNLVKDLHLKRPWKSYLTATLVQGFVTYLKEDRKDINNKIPELVDIATLEMFSLKTSRTEETEHSSFNFEKISKLTVAELLALGCEISKTVSIAEFTYDVITYRQNFYNNDRKLPPNNIDKITTFALGSRDSYNNTCWSEISKNIYDFIRENLSQSFTLNDLATTYIEGIVDEKSEQELFQDYMIFLKTLVDDGALLIRETI